MIETNLPEMWSVILAIRYTAIRQLEGEGKIRRDILWYSDYTEDEHSAISERVKALRKLSN